MTWVRKITNSDGIYYITLTCMQLQEYDKYTNKFDEQQLKLINKLNKVTDDFLEGIKNDEKV